MRSRRASDSLIVPVILATACPNTGRPFVTYYVTNRPGCRGEGSCSRKVPAFLACMNPAKKQKRALRIQASALAGQAIIHALPGEPEDSGQVGLAAPLREVVGSPPDKFVPQRGCGPRLQGSADLAAVDPADRLREVPGGNCGGVCKRFNHADRQLNVRPGCKRAHVCNVIYYKPARQARARPPGRPCLKSKTPQGAFGCRGGDGDCTRL